MVIDVYICFGNESVAGLENYTYKCPFNKDDMPLHITNNDWYINISGSYDTNYLWIYFFEKKQNNFFEKMWNKNGIYGVCQHTIGANNQLIESSRISHCSLKYEKVNWSILSDKNNEISYYINKMNNKIYIYDKIDEIKYNYYKKIKLIEEFTEKFKNYNQEEIMEFIEIILKKYKINNIFLKSYN